MATRQKILDAAYELFERQGYDETSYTDIAKLAGLGYGTIYIHFDSKEGLLLEHYIDVIHKQAELLRSVKHEGRNPLEHGLYLIDQAWAANFTRPIRKLTVFFSYLWVSPKENFNRVLDVTNTVLDIIEAQFHAAQIERLIPKTVDVPTAMSLIRAAYLRALQAARFGDKEQVAAKLSLNQQVDYLLQLKNS